MSAGSMNTGRFAMLTGNADPRVRGPAVELGYGRPCDAMGSGLARSRGVFGYMSDVLSRQVDRLSQGVGRPAWYFYELSIRHEDMHVEALAYTRQTLGYARAKARASSRRSRGAWEGDVDVPGGRWRLGSTSD